MNTNKDANKAKQTAFIHIKHVYHNNINNNNNMRI